MCVDIKKLASANGSNAISTIKYSIRKLKEELLLKSKKIKKEFIVFSYGKTQLSPVAPSLTSTSTVVVLNALKASTYFNSN